LPAPILQNITGNNKLAPYGTRNTKLGQISIIRPEQIYIVP